MRYVKYVFILLLGITLSSCTPTEEDIEVTSINFLGREVVSYQIGVSDYTEYKLEIEYSDETTEQVSLSDQYIEDYNVNLFNTVGYKQVTIVYEGFSDTVTIKVYETSLDLQLLGIYDSAYTINATTLTYDEWLDTIRGEDGLDGEDGLGIESVSIQYGKLIIVYTDGTTVDLGKVVGDNGLNGTDGTQGPPGEPGVQGPPGEDNMTDYHVVNFYSVQGFIISSQLVADGEDAIGFVPQMPDGYVFVEWSINFTSVHSDLSVFPAYNLKKHTITFDYEGVDPITNITHGHYVYLPIPEKHGYVFKGWYHGQGVNSRRIYDQTKITDDITVYPKFEEGIYYLSFEMNGGDDKENRVLTYTSLLEYDDVGVKTDSEFLGWYTDEFFTNELDITDLEPGEHRIYAKWFDAVVSEVSNMKDGVMTDYIVVVSYHGDELNVVIPDELRGKPVLSIGSDAFRGNMMHSITLPSNLWVIENDVFRECANITEVILPASIEYLGTGVFMDASDLETVTFNSVVDIPDFFFYGTEELEDIILPAGTTSIGTGAFQNSGVTSIIIPDSVVSIGNSAFSGASRLTSVAIPGNVTSINANTFFETDLLTDVTLPNTVETIGMEAFMYSGIVNINWPTSLTSIDDYAFRGTQIEHVVLPEGVTSIGEQAFISCYRMKDVFIPSTVTSIGDSAFNSNDDLETIDVAAGNTQYSSDNGVLYNNDYSYLYNIPNSYQNTTYNLHANMTDLATFALVNTTVLTLGVPDTFIGNFPLNLRGMSFLMNVNVYENSGPDYYTSVNGVLFANNGHVLVKYGRQRPDSTYAVPSGVEHISSYAFEGVWNLTTLTFPNSLISTGTGAFMNMEYLQNVTLPSNMQSIGSHTFYNCDTITQLTIPSTVQNIGTRSFAEMENLTHLYLNGNAHVIDSYIVNNSINLQALEIGGASSIDKHAFFGISDSSYVLITGGGNYMTDSSGVVYENLSPGYNLSHYPANVEDTNYSTYPGTLQISALFGDNDYIEDLYTGVECREFLDNIFYDNTSLDLIYINYNGVMNANIAAQLWNDTYNNDLVVYVADLYNDFMLSSYVPADIKARILSS